MFGLLIIEMDSVLLSLPECDTRSPTLEEALSYARSNIRLLDSCSRKDSRSVVELLSKSAETVQDDDSGLLAVLRLVAKV